MLKKQDYYHNANNLEKMWDNVVMIKNPINIIACFCVVNNCNKWQPQIKQLFSYNNLLSYLITNNLFKNFLLKHKSKWQQKQAKYSNNYYYHNRCKIGSTFGSKW